MGNNSINYNSYICCIRLIRTTINIKDMKYTLNDYRQHKDYKTILNRKGVSPSEFEQKGEDEQLNMLIQWFKEEKKRITKPKNKHVKTISELQKEVMSNASLSNDEKVTKWNDLEKIKEKESEIKEKENRLLMEKEELKKLKQKYNL